MKVRGGRRVRLADESGITLIELVFCVGVVGFIAAALTGIMISELRNDVATAARMDESFDVQFATTYWQRDVSSIGRRDAAPERPEDDPYALVYTTQQSVFTDGSNACDLSGVGGAAAQRTAIVTLAWSEYDPSAIASVASTTDANGDGIPDDDAPRQPHDVKVTWVAKASATGGAPYELWRVRCGYSGPSTARFGHNLAAVPTVACTPACASVSPLPRTITLNMASLAGTNTVPYAATLTGERRQS